MSKVDQRKKKAEKAAKERAEAGTGLAAFNQTQAAKAGQSPSEILEQAVNRVYYPSGCLMIDRLIGVNKRVNESTFLRGIGLPSRTLIEVAGEPGSGKTTFCITAAAQVQKRGGTVAYVNSEQAMDFEYAQHLGLSLDADKLVYLTPATYEETSSTIHGLIVQGKVDLLIIDSVSSLLSDERLKSEENITKKVAEAAAFWSGFLPKLLKLANDHGTMILAVNQYRMTGIGGYGQVAKKDTMGGNAVKYYKSLAIWMNGKKDAKAQVTNEFGQEVYASSITETRIEIEKNKWGKPSGVGVVPIIWGEGFDNFDTLFRLALGKGLIKQKGGGYYEYESTNPEAAFSLRGADQTKDHVKSKPVVIKDLCEKLEVANPEAYFPQIIEE